MGLFLESLQRSPLNDYQRTVLGHAHAASGAAAEMLTTLLDYSRLEAGVVKVRPEAFAVQPLLTALLAAPLLSESVTRRQWCGILGGFAGIVLVLAPRLAVVDMAAVVALPILANFGATVSVTLGTFYQKRFVAGMDLRIGTLLQFVGALAVVAPLRISAKTVRGPAGPAERVQLMVLVKGIQGPKLPSSLRSRISAQVP